MKPAAKLPTAIVQSLREVKGTSAQLDQLIDKVLDLDSVPDTPNLASQTKPDWHIFCRTMVKGVIAGETVFTNFAADFNINMANFIKNVDAMPTASQSILDQMQAASAASSVINAEVKSIIIKALMPQTWGWLVSFRTMDDQGQLLPESKVTGAIELVYQDKLVHLNWTDLVSHQLPAPYYISPELFWQQCVVPFAHFTDAKPFNYSWSYADDVNGEALSLTINLEAAPLT